MTDRIQVKVIGSSSESVSQTQDHKASFTSSLKNILGSFDFVLDGGIERLSALVLFDRKVELQNPLVYNERIFLHFSNYPLSVSSEQDIKNSVFRAKLDLFLKKSSLIEHMAKRVTLLVFYNKDLQQLNIKEKNKVNNEKEIATTLIASEPRYRLEQVVLNSELVAEIRKTLTILHHRHIIYELWGFNEIDPEPKAIINFFGPPGTGKTMTAHAIAHELGIQIMVLNYADIESKFVGDAPKNLVRAFETAASKNALLFFDEADSFLGKRISNVSSSSDQAVNSLRSQLLMLLENFEGVVVFATNLVTNYDRAFESRIFKHLKFELPNERNRAIMIKALIPSKVPFENSVFLSEAEQHELVRISDGFSGRDMKNAILESLSITVSDGRPAVNYLDFKKGFEHIKDVKQALGEERTSLFEKKATLEQKIKTHLETENTNKIDLQEPDARHDFYLTLMEILSHAAYSDGILQPEERIVIEKTAISFGVAYELPSDASSLPPLETLFENVSSWEDKVTALELAVHIVAADGEFMDSERVFIQELCQILDIPMNLVLQVLRFTERASDNEQMWLNLKKEILELEYLENRDKSNPTYESNSSLLAD